MFSTIDVIEVEFLVVDVLELDVLGVRHFIVSIKNERNALRKFKIKKRSILELIQFKFYCCLLLFTFKIQFMILKPFFNTSNK
jgi:hypothetical protein